MFIEGYVRLEVEGVTSLELVERYLHWVLGTDVQTPGNRTLRIQQGVRRDWTPELLRDHGSLSFHRCRIDFRSDENHTLLGYTHGDSDPRVDWHTLVHVTALGSNRACLEHGIGRSVPLGFMPPPTPSVPRVVRTLLQESGLKVLPYEATLPLQRLATRQEAERFVTQILLDRGRRLPCVVTSFLDNEPLVDAENLSRKLVGSHMVAVLETLDAVRGWTRALAERSYGDEYRCFGGAIHTYDPFSEKEWKHRIWLGRSIEALPPDIRITTVAGQLSRRAAVECIPSSYFSSIDRFDSELRRTAFEGHRKRASDPPANRALAEAKVEAQTALEWASKFERDASLSFQMAENAFAEKQEAERRVEDYVAKIDELQMHVLELRKGLSRRSSLAPATSMLSSSEHLAVLASLPQDIEAVLRVISTLHGQRVHVLDEAFRSARDTDFNAAPKGISVAWECLWAVATQLHSVWIKDPGCDLAKAFKEASGFELAMSEGSTTQKNPRFMKLRARAYKGNTVHVVPHVKARSGNKYFRVYFCLDSEESKIVIGHVGDHLDTAGTQYAG